MEELKPNKILHFNRNQLTDVRKTFGYGDVGRLKQDIEILKNWVRKQNHFIVKEFDRGYLERLIIYNKGSVERAKKRLDNLCTFRNLMPEFLRDFDVKNEFNHLLNCAQICVLPSPTVDNYRVVITRIFDDHEQITLLTYYRFIILLVEYMLANDYCQGYVLVIDLREMPFSMASKFNPIVIHKATYLIVETLSQRMKSMNFLSGSKFLDAALTIVKQAVSDKLKKRIHVHQDFDSIHNNLPKDTLPSDYGGKEKSMKELMEIIFEELTSDEHIARVKYMENAATNENLRLSSKFNEEYSGLPGSFKTLCVD